MQLFMPFLAGSIDFQCGEFVHRVCVFTGKMMALANQKLRNPPQMVLKYVVSSVFLV